MVPGCLGISRITTNGGTHTPGQVTHINDSLTCYWRKFSAIPHPIIPPLLLTQVAASLLSHIDSFLERMTATEVATMKELSSTLPGKHFKKMMQKAETK